MWAARIRESPRVRDAALAVGALAAGLLLLRALPELRIVWLPGAAPPVGGDAVLVLVVACAAETVRRRRPLVGLAVSTAALAAGPAYLRTTDLVTLLVFADLLYCSVLFTSRRVSRAVCVVSAVLAVGLTLTSLVANGGRGALQTLLNLALLSTPVLWAAEVRRHRDLADAERDRAEQAARMSEMDREAAVAAERARMARDLHDIVAGQLSAIALQSEAALGAPDPELRERVLRAVRDASVSALTDMRTMIGLLRAGPEDGPRTAPARLDQLDPLLDSARSWGLRVTVRDDRPVPDAGTAAGVEIAAYRIVQEGLTNAAKHAPGSDVALALWHDDDRLVVRLRNDRAGARRPGPDGTSSGTGLAGLAERAAAVGGTVVAGPAPAPERGWELRAVLPLRHDAGG